MAMDTEARDYAQIESEWDELAAGSLRRHMHAGGGWSALLQLEPPHRDVVVIDKLTLDLFNGGFVQFFCNWGYDVYKLATDALDAIDAQRAKLILEQAYSILSRLENCDALTELWDIPRFLTEQEAAALDALDAAYWQDDDFVFRRAIDYFRPLL